MTDNTILSGHKRSFSPAEQTGIICLLMALPLFVLQPILAIIPLAAFLLMCLISPFLPWSTFFIPLIARGRTNGAKVSLTFDDGPDPVSTPPLLLLLKRRGVLATFFVTGERAVKYPRLIERILAEGHTIGNHSYSHDDFIMFRSVTRLRGEILQCQDVLLPFGIKPKLFRPPVGITTSRYSDALHGSGLTAVNFRTRPRDLGNRRLNKLAGRILADLCHDDIILLHDIPPRLGATLPQWLHEVEALIRGIEQRGIAIVEIAELLQQPAMIRLQNPPKI